jgi:hypothetical protein
MIVGRKVERREDVEEAQATRMEDEIVGEEEEVMRWGL